MSIPLRHSATTLAVGTVSAAFFFWLAAVSFTTGRHPAATIGTTLCFVALGLMALPMVLDYFLARHEVDDDRLDFGRRLGGRGTMRWVEVRRVRFSPTMKWFVLEDGAGAKARIAAGLSGLPEFARLALAHVPADALDKKTRKLLVDASLGRRPRVWL
ncbi:hypothetical protein [Mitsuaria sp. GD03876]|uniref:hypothetical protein n=1 Tax=Mitsuaria sp. GD03876 TaxID=2975399 RepID=UPI002446C233|nr:hypothetical protein [Mitsuaria sp. GD03876]MDH0867652.1 hypothetical protein [Mitsuaria sp. GD03876]